MSSAGRADRWMSWWIPITPAKGSGQSLRLVGVYVTLCSVNVIAMLHPRSPRISLPLPLALLGFVLALFGTYWDDAWHTDKGRDSFLIPPHICLYLGITLVGVVLAAHAWAGIRGQGWRSLGQPAMALAASGVAITLAAAPIDNAWHLAFGRDAVLWSPPHMLGVAGSLALAVGLLMLLADGGWGRPFQFVAGSGVLAVGLIPVLEYETDVPQFALLWFLPVLAFGSAFTLGLVKSVIGGAWAATLSTAAYAILRLLIAAVLGIAGLPTPILPMILLPALALDLASQRSANRGLIAIGFAGVLFLVYVPYLNWAKADVFIEPADALIGFPMAAFLSYLGFLLADLPRPRQPAGSIFARASVAGTVAMTAVLASLLISSPPALGHDPGQGPQEAKAQLTTSSRAGSASMTV